ncbi:MAG: glycerophosphodiester phosphodiesterase [Lentisphaerae bacterium]|nr:glycerophosphodiester phosphodiesterase [Lentisphaerota bacterium]
MDSSVRLPIIEAHRGASDECPENTLSAFRRAVELGAASIELDIHETKDGELVVMHDETVDRTTRGKGRLAALTLAELRALDCGAWKHARFAGERIPTLAEALELSRAHGVRFNVEVKAFSSPRAAERLVGLLREYAPAGGTHVVSSFHVDALLQVRQADAGVPLAMLGNFPAILDAARHHGFPWIHGAYRGVSSAVVTAAHAAAVQVMIWTMDEPGLLAYYAGMGVDKVCTNRPRLMLAEADVLAALLP